MYKQRPMKGELRRSALCNIPTHTLVDVKRPVQMLVSFKNEALVKFIKHAFRSHSFIQYSVWRQVQRLFQNDSST